jgi:beta-phosphoglucomutase family hydrolase
MTSSQNPLTHTEALDRLHTLRGVLFDLDGVLTPTAEVHMHAWSRLFTPFLEKQGVSPAYSDADYFEYIDGKPRYDGVRSLLASRGITLPDGLPTDSPDQDTVSGLGNRKNEAFTETLAEEGVTPYPGSQEFLDLATKAGLHVAVVTSSRNGELTLTAAGIRDRFEVVVDGLLSASRGLAGKPAPATYELGAELLGLTAAECVVVEDAQSGIQAGRAGNFGLVLGVDRGVGRQTLLDAGADIVVSDLDELVHAAGCHALNTTSATTEAHA